MEINQKVEDYLTLYKMRTMNNIATVKMTDVPAIFVQALKRYKHEVIGSSLVIYNTTAPTMRSLFHAVTGHYPQDMNVRVMEV